MTAMVSPPIEQLELVARRAVVSYKKGEDLVITAALAAKECRQRVKAGEYNGTWAKFCKIHLAGLSKRRIQQLLAIGQADNPQEALELHRAENAERNRKHRAKAKTSEAGASRDAPQGEADSSASEPPAGDSLSGLPRQSRRRSRSCHLKTRRSCRSRATRQRRSTRASPRMKCGGCTGA
jgi:hypothetical protein